MSLQEPRGELSSALAGAHDTCNGDRNANTVNIGSKEHMKLSTRYTSVDGRVPDRRMGPEGSSTETLLTSPCNGAEDDLVLGAEAKSITAASMLPGQHPPSIDSTKIENKDSDMNVHTLLDKRVKWQSLGSKLRDSVQSDHSERSTSSISSVDVLLQQRQMDPEAMLMDLGFGGMTSHHDSSSQIPPRFLIKPSEASGIEIDRYINNHADLQQIISAWKERNSSSGAWQHGFHSLLPSMRFITALQSSTRSPTSSQDLPAGIQSVLHPDNQRWLALQGYYDDWPEDVLKAQLNGEILSLVSAGKALRNQTSMDAKSKRNRFHATHSKVTMPMEKQINEDNGVIMDDDIWKRPVLKSFSNASTDSCVESVEGDHRLLSNGSELDELFIPLNDYDLDATAINNLSLTIAKHLPDPAGKLDSENDVASEMSLLELPKRPGDQFSDSGSGSDHTMVDDNQLQELKAELANSSMVHKLQRGQHLSSGSEVPCSSAVGPDIPLIKTDANSILVRNDSAQSDSSGFADTDNSVDMLNLELDLLKVAQLGSSAESDSTTNTVLQGRKLSQRHLSSISLPDCMDGEGLSTREMVDKCVSTNDLVWYPPLHSISPRQQVSVYHMELSKDWKSVLLSKEQSSVEQNHVSVMELQLGNGGVLPSTSNAVNESSITPICIKDPLKTSTPKESVNTSTPKNIDECREDELLNAPIASNWECVDYTISGTKQHWGTVLDLNSNYKMLTRPKSKEVFHKTNANSGDSNGHTVSTLKLNVVASDNKMHFEKADVLDKASSKFPHLLDKTSSKALRLLETDLDEVFEEKQFELKRHEAKNSAKSSAEDMSSKMNYSQLKILINQPVCYKGSFNSQMFRPFKDLSSLEDVDSHHSIENLKAETRLVQQSLQRYKTELCLMEAGFLDKQHNSDSQSEEESLAIEDLELLWSDVKEEILVMERLLSLRLKKLSRGLRTSGDSVSLLTVNVISQMVSLLKEQLFHRCMHHGIENAQMLETTSQNAIQQEVCHLLQDIQHQTTLQPTIRSREMDLLLEEMRSSLMSGMRKELRTNSNWIQRQLQLKDSRIKQLEDELAVLQHCDIPSDFRSYSDDLPSDFRSYSDDYPDGHRNYPEDHRDHPDRHRNFRSLQDELG